MKTKYSYNHPVDECPCCQDGVVRYKYCQKGAQLVEWVECDNLLCGYFYRLAPIVYKEPSYDEAETRW